MQRRPRAGSGDDTIGLFDPVTGTFRLRITNDNGQSDIVFQFGPPNSGWLPITGDWNDDGTDTIGLYDPVANVFRLRNSNRAGAANGVFQFGPRSSGWLPITGDRNRR